MSRMDDIYNYRKAIMEEVEKGVSPEQNTSLMFIHAALLEISDTLALMYDKENERLEKAESEVSEELSEKTFNAKNSCPNRCIDCEFFDERSHYVDDSINISACVVGSCKKRERNFVSSDPYNQVPNWCPLKGEKNEQGG